MIPNFAATLAKIADQLLATIELGPGRLIAIEIANQTNPQSDVVQIIAVNVAAINLPTPAIAYFDFAITGRGAVANYKMIGKTILHPTKMPVVIIESRRVSLTRPAVVDNNVLPSPLPDRCAVDLRPH